MTAWKI